jgi:BirA family biotin operon repressor/biotin-[acetyl-CoA-carboxylase] ligase
VSAPTWTITRVAETGSTNTDLLAAADTGAPHGSVLVTDHQVTGQGRLGRVWEAPPGTNLLVSLLFRSLGGPDPVPVAAAPGRAHELTQRVAVAAVAAVRRVSGLEAELKWPNDLLLGGRKLAGILAQAHASDGRLDAVVVGLGLNVRWAPEGAASLVAALGRRGVAPTPGDVCDALLDEVARGWDAPVFPVWRSALRTLGSVVQVELAGGAGVLVGTATDVRPDGALVVTGDDGVAHVVTVGDVHHLRSR